MTLAWTPDTAALVDREPVAPALGRWTISLLLVVLLHVAGIVAVLSWRVLPPSFELPPPAIMIDLPPVAIPLPVPVPPPPPVFPKPPEPEPELIKEPEPEIVPPKPEVVLQPKPKPKPVQKKVEAPPQPELPPMPAPPVPAQQVQAPPMPVPVAAPSVTPTYEGQVIALLNRHKRYPRAALVRGLQGVPVVRFKVDREGKLLSVALEHSCGHRLLDEEIVATVQRAAPLPPFPADMTQPQQEFVVPVRFELQH